MTRPAQWPAQLDKYIADNRQKPFSWGEHDCVSFTCGWYAMMTGNDLYSRWRGRYYSEYGSKKLMLVSGCRTLELFAQQELFGQPEYGVKSMARGDIAFADRALGICVGNGIVMLGIDGSSFIDVKEADMFWRV